METHEIEELVDDLETKVDRLRSLYEQYFMGIEKLEPLVPRKDVERKVQQLRREQIRNTAQRFRFQMLVQKYTTYQSYWARIVRRIDEGTYKRQIAGVRYPSVRPPAPAAPPEASSRIEDARAAEQPASKGRFFSDRPGLDDEFDNAFAAIGGGIPKAPGMPSFDPKAQKPKSHPAMPAVHPPAYKPRKSQEMEGVRVERKSQHPGPTEESQAAFRGPASMSPEAQKARKDRMLELAQRARKQQESVFPPSPSPAPPKAGSNADAPSNAPTARYAVVREGAAAGARTSNVDPHELRGAQVSRGAPPLPGRANGVLGNNAPGNNAPPLPPRVGAPPLPPRNPTFQGPPGAAPSASPTRPNAPPPQRPNAPNIPREDSASITVTSPNVPIRPPGAPPARPPALAQQAAARQGANPDVSDARVREIYNKYVESKRQQHESTAAITYDAVARTIRDSTEKLKEKHKGKNVDFEVTIKDGKTVLKPIVK